MASKRHQRKQSCDGKVAHKTEHDAATAKRKLIDKKGLVSGSVHVYKCQFCGYWHVGHVTAKEKRIRRWLNGE